MAAFLSYGQSNYNGWLDTSGITDTLAADSIAYSSSFQLSRHEDIRLLVKVDDTTSAGFAADSVQLRYGYQTGHATLNGSGLRDTAWDELIILDTLSSDNFGSTTEGSVAFDGTLTRAWGGVDTTNVAGYAYQSRWFVPEWDVYIRFFVYGMAGNNADAALLFYFELKRRLYVHVRED